MNKQTRIGDWVRRYNKEIFPLYSSFKGGADGKTVNVDKRQNILANPRLWGVVTLCVVGGIWGFRNVWSFFHPNQDKLPQVEAINKPINAAPLGSDSPLGLPSFSNQWRIAGRFASGNEAFVVLLDQSGRVRLESPSLVSGTGMLAVGVVDGLRVTTYSGASPQPMKGEQ